MSKPLSTYLDLLRFAAALAVFVNHLRNLVSPGLPWSISTNGPEAVALFFVLSGYVIAYVTQVKEDSWRSYAIARLARIYSVAILALIVTFVVDFIGRSTSPEIYANLEFYQPASFVSFIRAATFTTEVWKNHIVFGTDEPFWSLGFECAYYLIFGLICFVRKPYNWLCAAIAVGLAIPKIALYFPLWLLGVAAYRLGPRVGRLVRPRVAFATLLITPVAYYALHRWASAHTTAIFLWRVDPQERVWTFLYYYTLGIIFVTNLVAFDRAFRDQLVWPASISTAVRWLAGVTFTLYLTHQPMLIMWNSVLPADMLARTPAIVALTLAAVLLLGELGERRKAVFVALFTRILRRRPGSGAGEPAPAA